MTTMNEQNEQLSAFVDGETARFESKRMADVLLGDDELRRRWTHYHLIGEVLRQEKVTLADANFSRRVMQSIESEETTETTAAGSLLRRRWLKPVVGLAMAASVAGAMVIGLQSAMSPNGLGTGGALGQKPLEADMTTQTSVTQSNDPGYHVPNQLESYMRMNSYLLSHAEQSGAQGLMPYARMVGYTSGGS